MQAAAAATPGRRNLVVVFLGGGSCAHNAISPRTGANRTHYTSVRPGLALPDNPATALDANWQLHPSLTGLKTLWDAGKLAIIRNVGTLVYPTTRAQYLANSVELPPQLYSHSDQQDLWETGIGNQRTAETGWLGRMAELLIPFNTSTTVAQMISMNGPTDTFRAFDQRALALGTQGFSARNGGYRIEDGAMSILESTLQNTNLPNPLIQEYIESHKRAVAAAGVINNARDATPDPTNIPGGPLGERMRFIMRMIGGQSVLNQRRSIFFMSHGGYDHHFNQLAEETSRFDVLDPVLLEAYNTAVARGVSDNTTFVVYSEFGRSLRQNGTGSDHGWGGHAFVFGGNVTGGWYGNPYSLDPNGPDLVLSQCHMIPSTPIEAMISALAGWMGVPDATANGVNPMELVSPNLSRFPTRTIDLFGDAPPVDPEEPEEPTEIPAAFQSGQWSLEPTLSGFFLVVDTLPDGSVSSPNVTTIQYRINGGTPVATVDASASTFGIDSPAGVSITVEIRAGNSLGFSPWSGTKSVTPTPGETTDPGEPLPLDARMIVTGHSIPNAVIKWPLAGMIQAMGYTPTIVAGTGPYATAKYRWENDPAGPDSVRMRLETSGSTGYDLFLGTEAHGGVYNGRASVQEHITWSDAFGHALLWHNLAASKGAQTFYSNFWRNSPGNLFDAAWRASLNDEAPLWDSIIDHVNANKDSGTPDMRLVPWLEVFMAVYDGIQAGTITGISMPSLFTDDVHAESDAGKWIQMCTILVTMFNRPASEMPLSMNLEFSGTISISSGLAAQLRPIITAACASNPRAGVGSGGPTDPEEPEEPGGGEPPVGGEVGYTPAGGTENGLQFVKPAGATSSDLLILAMVYQDGRGGSNFPVVPPTGWTLIQRSRDDYDDGQGISVYWARGDVASTTFTRERGYIEGAMIKLSGMNLTTPVRAVAAAKTGDAIYQPGEYRENLPNPPITVNAGDTVLTFYHQMQHEDEIGAAAVGYTRLFSTAVPALQNRFYIQGRSNAPAGSTGFIENNSPGGNYTARAFITLGLRPA